MAIKVYYYGGTMIAWFKITFIILSNDREETGGCVREDGARMLLFSAITLQ